MWTAVLIRELSLQIVSCSWQVQRGSSDRAVQHSSGQLLYAIVGSLRIFGTRWVSFQEILGCQQRSGSRGRGVRGEGWSSFGGVEIGSCLGGVGGVSGGGGVVSTAAGGDGAL